MGVLMLSYHTHAIMFLKMIWSRFNFLFKDGDNCYLYNSLSNSLAQLDASVYNVLSENEDDSLFLSDKDDELFQRLCLMKAYVDSDEDEMLKLLATDGMLVKRPLLVGDDFVLVGFKEAEWSTALSQ